MPKNALERPIRIAYVVNKFETGGVKSLLMSYFHHISHEGFTIDFIVCKDGLAASERSAIESCGGLIRVAGSISNPLAYIKSCRKILREGNYDIVQVCMNSLNVFPLLAAKAAEVPVRISYNLSTSHPGERKTIAKNMLRPLGNLFATVRAANSDLAWNWLFGEKSCHERMIIPNAVSLKKYCFDEELRARTRSNFNWGDSFVIGHVGRYEYQKNHLFLIEVLKEVLARDPLAKLALVGYGSMKEQVFLKAKELEVAGSVIDLGSTEDLNGLYNAFDCFVLPSYYEGFPVVGIEAQATGCPCVLSTEVTEEARILDQTKLIPLSRTASEWAEAVLEFKGEKRRDGGERVALRGYEVVGAAERLETFYLDQVRQSHAKSELATGRDVL